MAKKFYIIIKAEGDDFSVAFPTSDMLAIYCYIDNLVQNGRRWTSHFEEESKVVEKFRPIQEEFDIWR